MYYVNDEECTQDFSLRQILNQQRPNTHYQFRIGIALVTKMDANLLRGYKIASRVEVIQTSQVD